MEFVHFTIKVSKVECVRMPEVAVTVRVYVPGGVPLFWLAVVLLLVPQPIMKAMAIPSSTSGIVEAAATRRTPGFTDRFPDISQSNATNSSMPSTNSRVPESGLGSKPGGEATAAFATVITLIETAAGAVVVTVSGPIGAAHDALGGAPEQLTVKFSWSPPLPPRADNWSV